MPYDMITQYPNEYWVSNLSIGLYEKVELSSLSPKIGISHLAIFQ